MYNINITCVTYVFQNAEALAKHVTVVVVGQLQAAYYRSTCTLDGCQNTKKIKDTRCSVTTASHEGTSNVSE